MLKMRLQRVGRVHEPSFRLVLTDSKNSTKSGRVGEILGSYDPRKKIDSLESERIRYWLSKGASPTDTVHNLLVRHRIINAKKINVSSISKKAPSAANPPASEARVTEALPLVEETVKEGAVVEEVTQEEVAPADDAIIEPVVDEETV